jgi:uncharacterized protein YabN with tetrapyrrole methylase and pyrophosphatase domain
LFAVSNLARKLNLEPEILLNSTSHKFYNRFNYIEKEIDKLNKDINSYSLEELDALWDKAKTVVG